MRGLRPDDAATAVAGVRRLSSESALGMGGTLAEFVGALSMVVMLAALAA